MSEVGLPAMQAERVGPTAPASSSSRPRLPSLRALITLIVVVPIAMVSIALVVISTVSARISAEQLGDEIVRGATDRIVADIHDYLHTAMRVSDLYRRRILDGTLPTDNLPSWERMLFEDLATNPDVASICFATPQGDCT
jgi:hypothetical protein